MTWICLRLRWDKYSKNIKGLGRVGTAFKDVGVEDLRNNSTHFFIMKIPNKTELMQIAVNHSSDINTKDFIEIYRKCTDKPY